MNQKVVIYIILSAILLYLYYRNRDFTVFAAFIVVVFATLVFGDAREGMNKRKGGKGGKGGGGGGKGGCNSLGFTVPAIDKDDKKGSLDKITQNIKKVADKHWPFEDMQGKTPKNEAAGDGWSEIQESATLKAEGEKLQKDTTKIDNVMSFIGGSAGIYEVFVTKPDGEKQDALIENLTKSEIAKAIKARISMVR
jgi:hypothetical protein